MLLPANVNYKPTPHLFLFLLSFIIFTFFAAFPAPALAELQGEGTSDAPYLIATADDLDEFRDIVNGIGEHSGNANLNAHAKLTADIDLSQLADETQKSNWTPIGPDNSNPYTGTFDGCGYTISNLSINGKLQYAGLFGYVGSGGTVQNLNVSGTIYNSSSEARTGGIAGYLDGGAVTNCSFSGKITMEDIRYLGGIVGYADNNSTVANCYNSAEVIITRPADTDYAGGIAGGVNASTVKNCFNEGSVTGISNAGGIAGNLDNGSAIVDCFNSGKIEAYNKGGIVGWHNGGTADNCGWLTGTATNGKGGGYSSDTINAESISDINSVVTSLSASMDKNEIEVGKTGAITLKLAPTTDGFSAHSGAVEGMNAEGYNENFVTVDKDETNGTFTVTGVAEGSTEITVKATLYATDFSSQSGYVSNGEEYIFTFPVTVVAASQSDDSSSGSGTSGSTGGGGGGCSADFGALALLAAVPLLFRRKK